MRNKKLQILIEGAVMVALATVLSLIKIYKLPWGGSVTLLSMLPIIVFSIRHGVLNGLGVSFVYSLIQLGFGIVFDGLIGWGLTPGMLIACMVFDYIFAFTILCIAGLFRTKGLAGQVAGAAIAIFLRFISHVLSGVYVFASAGKLWEGFETDNSWLYSIVYNACYMLPELIFTLAAVIIIFRLPQFKNISSVKD